MGATKALVPLKKPAIQVVLALVLMAPAAAFGWGAHLESWKGLAARERAEAAIANEARSALRDAWAARRIERRQERETADFARRYRIPVGLADRIHRAALDAGLSADLGFRLVRAESGFRARAISPRGAVGLTQVMPETAAWLEPGITHRSLLEPGTNLRLGFRYLQELLERYDGDTDLALTAYNRGPGLVDRLLARGQDPDNGYTELVLTGSSAVHAAFMRRRLEALRRGES